MSKERPQPTQPEPINPLYLPHEEMYKFMLQHRKLSEVSEETGKPQFVGGDALRKLVEEKKVGVGTLLRISPGGSVHVFYLLMPEGLLNYRDSTKPIQSYDDALNLVDSGGAVRWTVEDFDFYSHESLDYIRNSSGDISSQD